ncbi:phage head completion protein [Sporosarcina sp. FSL W7-1283]|uniref:phage head completion protein n=1 Tax=Sporosarcina sp. FSL W7-1283 TaxID=2921560 RepID=UPI0030FA51B5
MNYRYGNNPAEIKHRVTFLNPPGQIVGGWPSQEWTEHVTVWAAIETQKGYRIFNSDATQWQDKMV